MPLKDQEARRAYLKKYRETHKEFISGLNRKYREEHRDELNRYLVDWRKKLKDLVFGLIGTVCSCCNKSELEFLTVDHVNNDGSEQIRKKGYKNSYNYIGEIKRAIDTDDDAIIKAVLKKYQTMCWNCNVSKHYGNGICWHKRNAPLPTNSTAASDIREMKKKAIDKLGRSCLCCGETVYEFLTISHVNHDGYKENSPSGKRNNYRLYERIIVSPPEKIADVIIQVTRMTEDAPIKKHTLRLSPQGVYDCSCSLQLGDVFVTTGFRQRRSRFGLLSCGSHSHKARLLHHPVGCPCAQSFTLHGFRLLGPRLHHSVRVDQHRFSSTDFSVTLL